MGDHPLIEALLAGVEPGLGPDVVLVDPLTGLVPLRPLLVPIGLAGSFPGLPFLPSSRSRCSLRKLSIIRIHWLRTQLQMKTTMPAFRLGIGRLDLGPDVLLRY